MLLASNRISPSLLLCLLAAFATCFWHSNSRTNDASLYFVFWIQPSHAFVVTPPLAFKPKIQLLYRFNNNDPSFDVKHQRQRHRNVDGARSSLFSSTCTTTVQKATTRSQQQHHHENATDITTSSAAAGSPIISITKSTSTKGYHSVIQSQRPTPTSATHLQMVSFYRFVPIPQDHLEPLVHEIFDQWSHAIPGLRGSVYLATEGINGQLAIPLSAAVPELLATLVEQLLHSLEQQQQQQQQQTTSYSVLNWGDVVPIDTPTFERWIVRTRNAILRDGFDDYFGSNSDDMTVLDWNQAGDELSPAEWRDALLQPSPSTPPLIFDCRNDYESAQGTFQNAIPLHTSTFSESWNVLEGLLAEDTDENDKNKPIYIFCTGGIRCVKVGAFLTQTLGYQNVKRLQHGIIGYQKYIHSKEEHEESTTKSNCASPKEPSLWKGENFLFDKRRLATTRDAKNGVCSTNNEL